MNNWMIYGANGYTGQLIAAEAKRLGLNPVLAGRNAEALAKLSESTGFAHRVVSLDDAAGLRKAMADCALVLHCAGPFSATIKPMLDACMDTRSAYLDITGELDVFAHAHGQDERARKAGILVMPGVGFDVVPTDCMAATLHAALPDATELILAFDAAGGPSQGTAKSGIEGMAKGGAVRRDGKVVRVPLGWRSRDIPFAHGARHAMTIPWGDVYTAHVSTGIPNIDVYMSVPPVLVKRARRLEWVRPLLGLGFVQRWMKAKVEKGRAGPSDEKRANSRSEIWGEVRNASGKVCSGTLSTPNGYDLTAMTAVRIARHVLTQPVQAGFSTPSKLMGAEFITHIPGVVLSGPVCT
jgi:short subunit dehydrogenase-like uncharacterized protein